MYRNVGQEQDVYFSRKYICNKQLSSIYRDQRDRSTRGERSHLSSASFPAFSELRMKIPWYTLFDQKSEIFTSSFLSMFM